MSDDLPPPPPPAMPGVPVPPRPPASPPVPGMRVDSVRPLRRWGEGTIIALWLVAIASAGEILASVRWYGALSRLVEPDLDPEEQFLRALDADAALDLADTAGLVTLVLIVAIAVALLSFLWRARKHADAMGAAQRHGRGWVIGSWFTPLLNLWRPKEVVDDLLWAATTTRPEDRRPHGITALWWATFVIGNLVVQLQSRAPIEEMSLEEYGRAMRSNAIVNVVSASAWIVAAIALTRIVGLIRDGMTERHLQAQMDGLGLSPPPTPPAF